MSYIKRLRLRPLKGPFKGIPFMGDILPNEDMTTGSQDFYIESRPSEFRLLIPPNFIFKRQDILQTFFFTYIKPFENNLPIEGPI